MHLDLLLKSSRSRLIFGSLKVDNLLYCSAFLVNFSSFFLKARDLGLGFFVWFGGFCLFWFCFICLFAWFVWFDFFLLFFSPLSVDFSWFAFGDNFYHYLWLHCHSSHQYSQQSIKEMLPMRLPYAYIRALFSFFQWKKGNS